MIILQSHSFRKRSHSFLLDGFIMNTAIGMVSEPSSTGRHAHCTARAGTSSSQGGDPACLHKSKFKPFPSAEDLMESVLVGSMFRTLRMSFLVLVGDDWVSEQACVTEGNSTLTDIVRHVLIAANNKIARILSSGVCLRNIVGPK